jgi:CelD/BcsL family acetyltransferase involved in cellulose biosynthesis
MELTEILIGGVETITRIFIEWKALCEEGASNHPYFRPEWFSAFVKNFHIEIMLLTFRRGEKLRAVLPLMRKKSRLDGIPVKKLQAVFNLNSQRFDLIHGTDETERAEIVRALWKEIKRQSKWNVLELRLVNKDSWLNDLLAVAESENYKTGIWEMDKAPFIILPQAQDKEKLIEKYFNGLNKKRRLELNRRMRRLKELGKVEFVITREYKPELMRKYFDLEARSWKGRIGTSVTDDPNVAKLHDDFAGKVAAENALFIYELKLDDKTIAMQLRIMYNRQTMCWKTSYDEEYARYSPGNLLFREFISDCLRNNSQEVDLLSPPSVSKSIWASGERELVGFYIFQKGLLGWLLWKWKFSVISRLRKFKKTI